MCCAGKGSPQTGIKPEGDRSCVNAPGTHSLCAHDYCCVLRTILKCHHLPALELLSMKRPPLASGTHASPFGESDHFRSCTEVTSCHIYCLGTFLPLESGHRHLEVHPDHGCEQLTPSGLSVVFPGVHVPHLGSRFCTMTSLLWLFVFKSLYGCEFFFLLEKYPEGNVWMIWSVHVQLFKKLLNGFSSSCICLHSDPLTGGAQLPYSFRNTR